MNLEQATPEQQRARDLVTYPAWGPPLSVPQFLERELELRAHPWSRAVMQTWLLTGGSGVLASCETFRMAATVGTQSGDSWAVASVFTEQALRGRGYATELMNRLAGHLAAQPRALAITLYSDVGAALYERSGYRAHPGHDWLFSPLPGEPGEGVEVLDDECAPDAVKGEGPSTPLGTGLCITPTPTQLDWHWERERLYARLLNTPGLSFHVARAGHATAWFCAYLRTRELLVLWLQAPTAAQAEPLLRCAQRLAHQAGLKQVRLWQTLDLASLPGGRRTPREGELPMVRPLQPGWEKWSGVQRALWV